MVAIAFTVSSRRPGYLQRTLESWAAAPGIADAHAIFCLEPGGPDSAQLARGFRAHAGRVSLAYNSEVYGPARNTRLALERVLGISDYGIVAEEDVLVSNDVLEYHSWCRRMYGRVRHVAGVCSYSRSSNSAANEVVLAPFFNPLVWGTWRDRLPVVTATWGGIPGNPEAWDHHLLDDVVTRQGREFVFPCRSRAQHIGRYGQSHDQDWYQSTVSQCFASRYEPQRFRQVGLERRLASHG